MQWKLKKSSKKSEQESQRLLSFGQKYYSVILWILLLIIGAFGIYTLYKVTSDTLISQKKVNAADLQLRQTQLNIGRYETTSSLLQKKKNSKSAIPKINNVFGVSKATTSSGNQTQLP